MAYCVVTRESMASDSIGNRRISIKYSESTVDTAIENGSIVLVGSLITGQREVFGATKPAVDSAFENIALVTTPEVDPDPRKKNLSDFINPAGTIATADRLTKGDIFSVTKEGFTGTPAVGNIVELQAGTKLKPVSTLTSGSTKIGTIIDLVNGKYAILVG